MRRNQRVQDADAARREDLTRMLEARRREVVGQMHTTMRNVSSGASGHLDVRDEMDQSEVEVRQDVNVALLEIRGQMIARIDEALVRLAEGHYGSCVECGRDIAIARLAAMPFATRCMRCEQEREDDDRLRGVAARRVHDRQRYPLADVLPPKS